MTTITKLETENENKLFNYNSGTIHHFVIKPAGCLLENF